MRLGHSCEKGLFKSLVRFLLLNSIGLSYVERVIASFPMQLVFGAHSSIEIGHLAAKVVTVAVVVFWTLGKRLVS